MKKWTLLDTALTPTGTPLTLWHHDGDYTIRVNSIDLMGTRQHHSEEKLAEIACAKLKDKPGARVLIGGLGFGFTLRATLACMPAKANVVVAEIMPAVIEWNNKYVIAAKPMLDKRVEIRLADVYKVIHDSKAGAFDAILLDVDNGPQSFTADRNAKIYRREGLEKIAKILRPGGCVGFWSSYEDPPFHRLMEKAGFRVDKVRARSHPTSGGWHTIYFGYPQSIRAQRDRRK